MKRQSFLLIGSLLLSACGGGEQGAQNELRVDSSTTGALDSTAMRGIHGGPDHEFLAMMVDHHAGMVAMGADAMNRATDDSVKTAAHAMHQKQQAQQDTMVTMIQQMYGVQHRPSPMPKNVAQADSLRQTTGVATDQYFLRTTIAHHQEGVAMVDQYLPRLASPEIRRMAEMMKTEQQREIQELQGKLGSL